MSLTDIKNSIRSKKSDIDNLTLDYYANYFYVLSNNPQILGSNDIDQLIANGLLYASKIEFYDKDSEIYQELGPDCKGLREPKKKIIYIRKDLEEPLREMVIYHELHHAVQTNPKNNEVGLNQESNIARMIMEAQTQYFAEKVYSEIHQVTFPERDIPSEDLRMLSGGTITSSLHNYEMYDSILSKMAIILNVSKDFFVAINFLCENNSGLNKLKEVYEKAQKVYKFPYSFAELMFKLDYIYCVDLLAYKNNPDKEVILQGRETDGEYEIHPNKGAKLSLKRQFATLYDLDYQYFLCLLDAKVDFINFARYLFANKTRNVVSEILNNQNTSLEEVTK